MSNPSEIKFYNIGKPYYEFTNFFPVSFVISKIPANLGLSPYLTGGWKTSEHLFQAAKFAEKTIIEEIRRAPDMGFRQSGGVFWLANSTNGAHKDKIRNDWHRIKLGVMEWVIEQKFSQNEVLKKKLVDTGNATLIEASEGNDNYWGQDRNGNGKNNLGKILEKVRSRLATTSPPSPPKPNNPPPPPREEAPKPSEKENLKNSIKASNNWEEWNSNYAKISSFNNIKDQQELAEELLNSLANIINKSNDLVTLNNLQSNWRNHQFYTQNSERVVKIDQFYSDRQKEIAKKNTPSLPSQQKNPLTGTWPIILVIFSAIIILVIFIKRRKKSNLKK